MMAEIFRIDGRNLSFSVHDEFEILQMPVQWWMVLQNWSADGIYRYWKENPHLRFDTDGRKSTPGSYERKSTGCYSSEEFLKQLCPDLQKLTRAKRNSDICNEQESLLWHSMGALSSERPADIDDAYSNIPFPSNEPREEN